MMQQLLSLPCSYPSPLTIWCPEVTFQLSSHWDVVILPWDLKDGSAPILKVVDDVRKSLGPRYWLFFHQSQVEISETVTMRERLQEATLAVRAGGHQNLDPRGSARRSWDSDFCEWVLSSSFRKCVKILETGTNCDWNGCCFVGKELLCGLCLQEV